MNALPADEPLSVPRILAAKGRERIAMMTAYDAPTAALLDAAGFIDVATRRDLGGVERVVSGARP